MDYMGLFRVRNGPREGIVKSQTNKVIIQNKKGNCQSIISFLVLHRQCNLHKLDCQMSTNDKRKRQQDSDNSDTPKSSPQTLGKNE